MVQCTRSHLQGIQEANNQSTHAHCRTSSIPATHQQTSYRQEKL